MHKLWPRPSAAGPMRLKRRILTSSSEHEAFARMFESLSGNTVALDYLRQAQVRGFFRGDELLAGYVVNARAPFRYSSWVPTQARAELHQRGCLVEPSSAEITCMWVSQILGKFDRNRIYVRSVVDLFCSGRRFIFAGSRVEKVARIQKTTLPKTVYRGEATFGGRCEIYCAHRYVMIAHFVGAIIAKYAQDVARLTCSGQVRRLKAWMRVPDAALPQAPTHLRTTPAQR